MDSEDKKNLQLESINVYSRKCFYRLGKRISSPGKRIFFKGRFFYFESGLTLYQIQGNPWKNKRVLNVLAEFQGL